MTDDPDTSTSTLQRKRAGTRSSGRTSTGSATGRASSARTTVGASRRPPASAGARERSRDLPRAPVASGFAPATHARRPTRELCPGSDRRGARALWRKFDAAVTELERANNTTDPFRVARAFNHLADITETLAEHLERVERAVAAGSDPR